MNHNSSIRINLKTILFHIRSTVKRITGPLFDYPLGKENVVRSRVDEFRSKCLQKYEIHALKCNAFSNIH